MHDLPAPFNTDSAPFKINDVGWWLKISDIHIPFHDRRCLESAFADARAHAAVGLIVNGDLMDCGAVSDHDKDPGQPRLEDEIDKTQEFFVWARQQLGKNARFIYKQGNHEHRLPRYLAKRAPELGQLSALQLPNLLNLKNHGVEWVQDGRIVRLGRLPILHGHEFGRGAGGVNPARWLFLRTCGTATCGHFHRTSDHNESAIDGRLHTCWSVGCACDLSPLWLRQNKWNHGYALIEVHTGGHFLFHNRRILPDGRVVS